MSKPKIKLRTEDGNDIEENADEDDDIFIFLDELSRKEEIKYFMEEITNTEKFLRVFSSHKSTFYIKGFENRPMLFIGENISEKTLNLLDRYYTTQIQKLEALLFPISGLSNRIFMAFIKTLLSSLSDETIARLKKLPYKKVLEEETYRTTIEELRKNIKETDKMWKQITKELKELVYSSSLDFFTMAYILPYASISIIKNVQKNHDLTADEIESLVKTDTVFPVLTVYLCDNYKNHDYKSPPFHFVVLPHYGRFDSLSNPKCPICNKQLKKIRFFTFIPEISKRIMNPEGFYPYIVAYLLKKHEISFIPHVRGISEKSKKPRGEINEVDFIVTHGNKQFYIEIKCVKRKTELTEVGKKLEDSLKQIEKNIENWEKKRKVKFDGVFLVINYPQDEIEKTKLEYKRLSGLIQKEFKIIGYDNLKELIKELQNS
ncbi:hypothetical protein J7K41_00635 [Candidatus Micrarchaeota archaeon]|nr:hypothetical protein [Candidatus Micrarchaeota archaeon]